MAIVALILFLSILLLILYGYPVAITLGGLSTIYALCFLPVDSYGIIPARVFGVMTNYVLIAVPLFIFMGIMLEKSGLAGRLLETMGRLFGKLRGGLAVSVIVVGALLAASTGIVGATVVTMGLISLPTMLKHEYHPAFASGTVASSGTLGQIVPPSIVLILLGSVLNVSVGKLFSAALLPSMLLIGGYIAYVLLYAQFRPHHAPSIRVDEDSVKLKPAALIRVLVLPMLLIVAVLGSIFAGIASPTEAAAVGAIGATVLTVTEGRFQWAILREVAQETMHLTSMVFLILLGATTFAFVFRELGGDIYLVQLVEQTDLSPMVFLLFVMLIVFIAGFFIDFIEIVFIIVPVVAPLFSRMGVDLIWVGILLGLNLQTSFLTPPFGFSLFYLKGVAPPQVTTAAIYRGIIPFIILQIAVLLFVLLVPESIYWLTTD